MEQEIIAVVAKVAKIEPKKVTLESDLFNDLNIDSLLAVEILSALDRKYNLDIPEDRLTGIKKVKDIVSLVKELTKK